MRLFCALDLSTELKREVAEATAPLRAAAPALAWVREPLLHLTLKFFGEQPPEIMGALTDSILAIGARHREVMVQMGGIGAFPNFRRARVVWLGVEQEPRLELLHHDVEVAFEKLGFELDARPFRPHITLARVRRHLDHQAARALANEARSVDFRAEWVIQSVDLMQSELLPAGARYTTLVSAPLRSV